MAIIRELGQLRPANTTAASLFTPSTGQQGIVTTLVIVNVDSSSHDFRIFVDQDGTTYDQTTALYYDEALAATTTLLLSELSIPVANGGNIAVRSDTGSMFNFTAYGFIEKTPI